MSSLIVVKLSKTCPHAEGTNRYKKWIVLREGISVAEAHKAEPLCDLTYLRKMAKRGLLELQGTDAPVAAKPVKAPKAKAEEPKPEPVAKAPVKADKKASPVKQVSPKVVKADTKAKAKSKAKA